MATESPSLSPRDSQGDTPGKPGTGTGSVLRTNRSLSTQPSLAANVYDSYEGEGTAELVRFCHQFAPDDRSQAFRLATPATQRGVIRGLGRGKLSAAEVQAIAAALGER